MTKEEAVFESISVIGGHFGDCDGGCPYCDELLEALEYVDEALYKLWRKTEISSLKQRLIDAIQKEVLHPAIRKCKAE